MATITVTRTAPAPVPLPTVAYNVALGQLGQILDAHSTWRDPLSQRLFRWGAAVAAIDLSSPGALLVARARAFALLRELSAILVNPFDDSPLRDPVLDGDRVWEGWMLRDYCRIAPGAPSPYSGRPIQIRTHDFAVAMLRWLRSIQGEAPALAPQQGFGLPGYYQLLAGNVLLREQLEKTSSLLVRGTRGLEEVRAQAEQVAAQRAHQAEDRAAAHLEEVNQRIGVLERAGAAAIGIVRADLDAANHNLRQARAAQHQAENRAQGLAWREQNSAGRIAELERRVTDLQNADSGLCIIL